MTTLETRTYIELPPVEDNSIEWLKLRREGIGGSEVSTLLGMSNPDWGDVFTMWLDKTWQIPLDLNPPSEAAFWGHALEPVVRKRAADVLGAEITKPGMLRSVTHPFMQYSPDGFISDGRLYEGKTANAFKASEWKGQIPDHAELQVQSGMFVTGKDQALVAGLVGGQKLELFEVDRDDRIIAAILNAAEPFWTINVMGRKEPAVSGSKAATDALKALYGRKGGARKLPRSKFEEIHARALTHAAAEVREKMAKQQAQNELRRLMEGKEVLADEKDKVWAAIKNGPFASAKFRDKYPELHADYQVSTTKLDTARLKADHPNEYAEFVSTSLDVKKV
jgi:putative phage-type endonuclease